MKFPRRIDRGEVLEAGYIRPKCNLPCSAEKLGELGDPGFEARLFWKRLWHFLPSKLTRLRVINMSANNGYSFFRYQGRKGKRSN